MKVNVEKLENNLVKLDIEVDAEVAAQEYNKACRAISAHVNIPGFRKGKAPRPVVEKFVGPQRIQQEALEGLLPSVFSEVITEHKFELAIEPTVESFTFEVGKPLTIVAKIELRPEVKLKEYKGLEVEVAEFKHPEGAVEKELKTLTEKFATLEAVTDRETQATDVVFIDFEGSVDGEKIKGGAAKNYQLDLANSNFIPGFAEQLIGKKAGEEFTIDVTFPEEYHDETIKGKPAKFEIKINEIKTKVTPELNDELVKKVGPFETIDDLKKDIEAYLEKSQKLENESRSQKAILDRIIEQAEVDIPDSMIDREAKVLMEDFKQKMQAQGMAWEQVIGQDGHEEMWKNIKEEASNRIKNSLVLGTIAKEENIQVGDSEFNEKVKELAAMYGTDEKTIYAQLSQNPNMASVLTQQIISQSISNFLVENNTIKFVEDNKKEEVTAE